MCPRFVMPLDGSPILSDVRGPTLAIVCELCGRRGRYNVDRLMTEHGDAKLTDLLVTLADCPKARSDSITDAPRHILATRIHLISRNHEAGSPSSVRSESGCLYGSAFGTFMGMSNLHILHKSFHTRQPTPSTDWNIAGDDGTMLQFQRDPCFVLTRASEGVAQAHIARMCHSHCCNLSSDSAPDLPKPTRTSLQ